ncbi:hypothetical protein ACNQP7_23960 [Mycolicibacterium fortuitum]|uniref:hypothetical protein n=1 Tax=Mycolicibacterium fortuitum TaxID=1766 RepID=UPI003AB0D5A6
MSDQAQIHRYSDSPTGRETSIHAALRHKLAAKDKEIAALKATVAEQQSTIELLYGQLDTLHEQTP